LSASEQEVAALVDAVYAEGLPPGSVRVVERDGVRYFEIRPLALRCLGCGVSVPQSRTRVSVEARRLWVLHHSGCARDGFLA
jgi:hypothetical protein